MNFIFKAKIMFIAHKGSISMIKYYTVETFMMWACLKAALYDNRL